MRTVPIVPARLAFDADGVPHSPDYGDRYHPRAGASAQWRHVYFEGNELPGRWQGRRRYAILETGFGLGHNFLATWHAWRDDARRPERLSFVSIERHPLTAAQLAGLPREPALAGLAHQLVDAWPPLTPNLHRLAFEQGRVELLLAFGDVQDWLPELSLEADAYFLDGFAPGRNPAMWDLRVCKALGRLAAPGATLATWTAAASVRAGLRTAGFEVRRAGGIGGKRDITLARFAPAFVPRPSRGRPPAAASDGGRALIVGAGLAGSAVAWALAERGWCSTLVEQEADLALGASGNPGGLYHGIVNAQDGPHARFNRAAALAARDAVRVAIDAHGAAGTTDGLLRLETALPLDAMRALLDRLGLPAGYVEAVDADTASDLARVRLAHPAWHYPGGGWVDPRALARSFIERAGPSSTLRPGLRVRALRRGSEGWELLDAAGRTIDASATVVLANADDTLRLLGNPAWPVERIRGQLSGVPVDALPEALRHVRRPLAGVGYLLPPHRGRLWFGATSRRGDEDAAVRASDHAENLGRLRRLTDEPLALDPSALAGRAAWRFTADDRLPLIGPVPESIASSADRAAGRRADRPRDVLRQPGLYLCTGFASRGITWAALAGQLLAASITGTPSPVEKSLMKAVDPARFDRRTRRPPQRA